MGILIDGLPSHPLVEQTSELYRKFRPTTFKDVLGQDAAVKTLKSFLAEKRVPHALLFAGPSGTGKTTLARILRAKMQCHERNDFFDINAADKRGIDDIRDITNVVTIRPLCSPCRIWLIDEAHKLTDDAQGALLKALENTPPHAYFMLATTNPKKLRNEIRTRCTLITLNALTPADLKGAVMRMVELEGRSVDDAVLNKLVDVAEGSARRAVVDWDRIKSLPTVADQLLALAMGEELEVSAFKMCQLLMNKASKWEEVAEIISGLREKKGEEPEGLRQMVLKYATTTLLGKGVVFNGMAQHILNNFEDHLPWSGIPGWASLTRAAFTIMMSHKQR